MNFPALYTFAAGIVLGLTYQEFPEIGWYRRVMVCVVVATAWPLFVAVAMWLYLSDHIKWNP